MVAGETQQSTSGMVDNDEAQAALLYSAYAGVDVLPAWEALPKVEQWRWLRVNRLRQHMEIDLCAKLARDSYRKRFEQRLIERLQRWEAGR